jgi:uncharacterized membrane protein YdjX (TVP38/TMEM64 family)
MMDTKIHKSDIRTWIKSPRNWTTVILPLLLILAVFVAGRLIDLHVYIEAIRAWIFSFGLWGPVVYLLIYVAAELAFLPGTPFTILAALFFGVLWGFVTMLTGATLAAAAGFVIARYVARERIQKRLENNEEFLKLTRWVEENPWLAIPFIHIMPIFPFSLSNYALGLTKIRLRTFLLTSVTAFVPLNGLLILGANALYRTMVQGEISWWLILGTTGAGLVVLVLGYLGKRTFNHKS